VRPEGAAVLHQAHGAGGARPQLQRQVGPELGDVLVRPPSDRCRKPSGSRMGCGVCQNASTRRLDGGLRGLRAIE
jgi:hypothetical protein